MRGLENAFDGTIKHPGQGERETDFRTFRQEKGGTVVKGKGSRRGYEACQRKNTRRK